MNTSFKELNLLRYGERGYFHPFNVNVSSISLVRPVTDDDISVLDRCIVSCGTLPRSIVEITGTGTFLCSDPYESVVDTSEMSSEEEKPTAKPSLEDDEKTAENILTRIGGVKRFSRRLEFSDDLVCKDVKEHSVSFLLMKDCVVVQDRSGGDIMCMNIPEFLNMKYDESASNKSAAVTTVFIPISCSENTIDILYHLEIDKKSRATMLYLKSVISTYLKFTKDTVSSFGYSYAYYQNVYQKASSDPLRNR